MAFRFRKSKSFFGGLLRLTAGKKGLGLSVGVPGARMSVNTSGRRTTTVGIPGTGLSWSETERRHTPNGASTPSETTAAMTCARGRQRSRYRSPGRLHRTAPG